jgi:hypothetical protein
MFIIKWINHLHLLRFQQHRINQHHTSPNCPSCKHPHEDDYHLLYCTQALQCSFISHVKSWPIVLFNQQHVQHNTTISNLQKKSYNKHQASSFLNELISKIWALIHSIWLLQNELLHGTSSTPLHSIKRLHLISEISSLYNMALSILFASDHTIIDYFLTEHQKHLTMPLRALLPPLSNAASKILQ